MSLSRHYGRKPSEILGVREEYAGFCLDEACAYIWRRMTNENPEQPRFAGEKNDLIAFLKKREEATP